MVKKFYPFLFLFLFIVLSITLGFLLFLKTPIFIRNNADLLKEAKQLSLQGFSTHDDNLKRQAIDKYSIWLSRNANKSNKKLIADALRSRANAFIGLGYTNKAISDYKKSIEYQPIAQLQSIICSLEKEQGSLSKLSDLQECYAKAVKLFIQNRIPRNNVDFLLSRIWSGDESAIIDYKNFYRASTGRERKEKSMK